MWAIKFNQDTDLKGVGTVTAFQDEIAYSRRVDTTDSKDVDAFCLEAKELYAKIGTGKTEISTVASVIEGVINV